MFNKLSHTHIFSELKTCSADDAVDWYRGCGSTLLRNVAKSS